MNENFAGRVMATAAKTGLSPEEIVKRLEAQRLLADSGYCEDFAAACDFGLDDPIRKFESGMEVKRIQARQKIEEDRLKTCQENRDCHIRVSGFAGAKRIGPPSAKAMGQHSESARQCLPN